MLFRALVDKFGLFPEGECVYELRSIVPKRKYEADIALPRFRIAVEMDGYRSHGISLDGFKRDREKWLEFSKCGWLVIPVSAEQVKNQLERVIEDISTCVENRQKTHCTIIDKSTTIGAQYSPEPPTIK